VARVVADHAVVMTVADAAADVVKVAAEDVTVVAAEDVMAVVVAEEAVEITVVDRDN
jgi:hypothetical protein